MIRFLVFVLTVTSSCYAVDATGFVRPERCDIYDHFSSDTLYLRHIANHQSSRTIAIQFPSAMAWPYLQNEWLDVAGQACEGCEVVVHAKIRIRKTSESRFNPFRPLRGRMINGVSGDFEVELSDGKKEQGSFRAKLRKPKQLLICL